MRWDRHSPRTPGDASGAMPVWHQTIVMFGNAVAICRILFSPFCPSWSMLKSLWNMITRPVSAMYSADERKHS